MALMLLASMLAGVARVSPASAAQPSEASGERAAPKRLPSLDTLLGTVKTQVIVKFKPGVSAADARALIRATGGAEKKSLDSLRLANYASASGAEAALNRFNRHGSVASAFYNQRIKRSPTSYEKDLSAFGMRTPPRTPGPKGARLPTATQPVAGADSLGGFQYHLERTGDTMAPAPEPNAPIVAVIDSGLDYTNPDMRGRMQACPSVPGLPCDLIGYDQDPMDDLFAHGSHVASTIAGEADGSGIRGVSPNSKILPVRIFDEFGYTDLITIFQALEYTAQAKVQLPNLRVANMSWGLYELKGSVVHREFNDRLRTLSRAGVLPVASAGNGSSFIQQAYALIQGEEVVDVPAQSPGVLAVAATDFTDYRTFFSSYSTPINLNKCTKYYVDPEYPEYKQCAAQNEYTKKVYRFAPIAAPGWMVLAATTRGRYELFSGTSMSSPIVAGAAARVMARYPRLSNHQVRQRLIATGMPLGRSKGFPITTNRLDLRRALGVEGTGFTGRVMDGVTAQPLEGALVSLRAGGAVVATARTNVAGYYTLPAAAGGAYTLSASKDAAPAYVANARPAKAVRGRFSDPGDISLAPKRTDGAYTMMLEWNNVLTGIYEFESELYYIDYNAPKKARKQYPWPVEARTMPFTLADTYYGVPYPREQKDSMEFSYWNPGSLAAFPYARVDDWGFDLAPHNGLVVRQLPPVGSARYGVKWLSPGGPKQTGAKITVYKNDRVVTRSELAAASAPKDGTRGSGVFRIESEWGDGASPSTWELYDIAESGRFRYAQGNRNGARSDYQDWIHRNNSIRGDRGPAVGKRVTARLDPYNWEEESGAGPVLYDYIDVYNVQLKGGKTYNFVLNLPRKAEWELVLWGPNAVTGWQEPVRYSRRLGANLVLTYKVKPGKGGRYYVGVSGWERSGAYILSSPAKLPKKKK